jgi:hypothetical protein
MPLLATSARVHVRFDGCSYDLPADRLGLSDRSTDDQVKLAVARHLEVLPSRLDDVVVDRHPNGNLSVRPEAVFG